MFNRFSLNGRQCNCKDITIKTGKSVHVVFLLKSFVCPDFNTICVLVLLSVRLLVPKCEAKLGRGIQWEEEMRLVQFKLIFHGETKAGIK